MLPKLSAQLSELNNSVASFFTSSYNEINDSSLVLIELLSHQMPLSVLETGLLLPLPLLLRRQLKKKERKEEQDLNCSIS